MYSERGRPSIPPELLLKACLFIALFSVRSERAFCERLDYDLMFRFFLDMGLEEESFDASTFLSRKVGRLVDWRGGFFARAVSVLRRGVPRGGSSVAARGPFGPLSALLFSASC
jgi:hypothetical protein